MYIYCLNNDLSLTDEQEKESDILCPVRTQSTSVSDLENFNGHGRPFDVGCGALTTQEYVVTPDLRNPQECRWATRKKAKTTKTENSKKHKIKKYTTAPSPNYKILKIVTVTCGNIC